MTCDSHAVKKLVPVFWVLVIKALAIFKILNILVGFEVGLDRKLNVS